MTWAPDIVALAIATDGQNEFAATFDQESGALALVVPTPNGPVYRSTRETKLPKDDQLVNRGDACRAEIRSSTKELNQQMIESESLRAADSARTAGRPFIMSRAMEIERLTADL